MVNNNRVILLTMPNGVHWTRLERKHLLFLLSLLFQRAFLDHLAADSTFLSFPFTANALTALFIIFYVHW